MDIILEICDGVFFDKVYAAVLPIHPSVSAFDPVSTIAASGKGYTDVNATWDAAANLAYGDFARSGWQWQPASQYLSVRPTQYAYMSRWDRDNIYRQVISMFTLAYVFANVIYFLLATLSYVFVFDKTTFQHPKYLKNQMKLEIQQTVKSIPLMAVLTIPWFIAEIRGYSYMYDTTTAPGFKHPLLDLFGGWYNIIQLPFFLLFTDFCIYWIHRALHTRLLYKRLHKSHHKWIMPTPYASHAFHPLDAYMQSIPYHLFPFLFPLQNFCFLALFIFIQFWTVMIHDGEYMSNSPVINGAACHTLHHLYFNYNYGQFTTLWDRLGGSYRKPNDELFNKETKMSPEEWERQRREMEKAVKEVEGKDDRSYAPPDRLTKKLQ